MNKPHCPFVLAILDGWGYTDDQTANAITSAIAPNWTRWWKTYPHTLLDCSGEAVGLPAGQMGNSEVGHMHIGGGRVLMQDLLRINNAIKDHSFANNPVLLAALNTAKQKQSRVHVAILLSPGGVHSHEKHLFAFLEMAREHYDHISVHAILDGRDTPPQSATASLIALQTIIDRMPDAEVATVSGRYYAMDRDHRWERTELAYRAIVGDSSSPSYADGFGGAVAVSAIEALEVAYKRGENDEFVQPTRIQGSHSLQAGDVFVFLNFRADRARQLSLALVDPDFDGFTRQPIPLSAFVTMTEYLPTLTPNVAYPPRSLQNTLGECLSLQGYTQLRIAETEKYAHVTFFFNGGRETTFPGEERMLVPSPKIATYDLQPEMSAPAVTDHVVACIDAEQYDVIILNFANADMVGHTGNFPATVAAIECLDTCLGRIYSALQAKNGEMLITADHGNAEKMYDPLTHQPHTAHTTDPVPLLYLGRPGSFIQERGNLIDVAPTILQLLGLPIPSEMEGSALVKLV